MGKKNNPNNKIFRKIIYKPFKFILEKENEITEEEIKKIGSLIQPFYLEICDEITRLDIEKKINKIFKAKVSFIGIKQDLLIFLF